jgi:hypothetical protein
MSDEGTGGMFDASEYDRWADDWKGMPEYANDVLEPDCSMLVHFASKDDRRAFLILVGQESLANTDHSITPSIWYPKLEHVKFVDKQYRSEEPQR